MIKGFIQKIKKKSGRKSCVETDAIPENPKQTVVPISGLNETQLNYSFQQGFLTNDTRSGGIISEKNVNDPANLPSNEGSIISVALPHNDNTLNNNIEVSPITNCSQHTAATPSLSIRINGSSGFQLGDTVHINMGGGSVINFSSGGFGFDNFGQSLTRKQPQDVNSKAIANSLKPLNRNDICVISDHISENWKDFVMAIGMPLSSATLNFIEDTDLDKCKHVAQLLHSFLDTYPDTSIGFIASKLKQTGNVDAFLELSKFYCERGL